MGSDLDMARAYALLGNQQQAVRRINLLWQFSEQMLSYYLSLSSTTLRQNAEACSRQLYYLGHILNVADAIAHPEAATMRQTLEHLVERLS